MTRDELIKKLRKIWDMDLLEASFCNELPLTLKEMNKAIEETVTMILQDRKRIIAPLVGLCWDDGKLMDTIVNIDNAIKETLLCAGLEK